MLFLQKHKIFERLGLRPQTPVTAPPPMQNSGDAPGCSTGSLVEEMEPYTYAGV